MVRRHQKLLFDDVGQKQKLPSKMEFIYVVKMGNIARRAIPLDLVLRGDLFQCRVFFMKNVQDPFGVPPKITLFLYYCLVYTDCYLSSISDG